MPYRQTSRVAAEAWEEEDPYTAYKEAESHEASEREPLEAKYFRAQFRRASLARRFRRSDADVAKLFSVLAAEWREATAFESNVERMVLNSAYQRIIGLGPQVLPYMLKDLDETHDHWFWALMAIAGEDKASGQTSVGAATEAWLAWGRSVGVFND
jgi:hypothetical protein